MDKAQLLLMLQQIMDDTTMDPTERDYLIRALHNQIADYYLNCYLGGTLYTEIRVKSL